MYRRLDPPHNAYNDRIDYWKDATFAEWDQYMLDYFTTNEDVHLKLKQIVAKIKKA